MSIVPKNFWYFQAMENVKETVEDGARPTISELIDLAKLEQLHRIANTLARLEKKESK